MLGWTLGILTGYSANLVTGSHAETGRGGWNGRSGIEKVWGGGDGSGSSGSGGELDGRWLKLNSRVGRKMRGEGAENGA